MRLSFLALVPLLLLIGCTAIRPVPARPGQLPVPQTFSHADFERVLQRFVDTHGRVDYAALKRDADDLERYYSLLSIYSPDSHPHLFPTQAHRLAYWLNAYNAAAIKTVLTHYPIASIEEIKQPWPFFFLSTKSGFFVFQRLTFGARTTNLYVLENRVIRKRFAEPRIHFALNCAARGCPRLPQRAFVAEYLEAQIEHETRMFLAETRNFTIHHHTKTIWLSSIFDWFEKDFLTWYADKFPNQEATLLHYIALYLPAESAAELQQAATYTLRFLPYDWGLNDQRSTG